MHPGTRDTSAGLLAQFLAWIAQRPRTYAETMDSWRTSCPRISVWEDALLEGLVETRSVAAAKQGEVSVILTEAGKRRLAARPAPLSSPVSRAA